VIFTKGEQTVKSDFSWPQSKEELETFEPISQVATYFRSRPAFRSKNKQPFSQGTQAQNRTPQRQNIRICMGIYREFHEIGKITLKCTYLMK